MFCSRVIYRRTDLLRAALAQPRALSTATKYDVVIVGGGLVGNAAAVALAMQEKLEDKRILVLDQATNAAKFEAEDPGFNLRVINLTVGNKKFLDKLGVWEKIVAMRNHSYDKIYCWEAHSNHTISFAADPMGYIVENNVIECALTQVAEKLHNVEIRRGVKVSAVTLPLEQTTSPVTIGLESGEELETDLLVGADGANSFVRSNLESPTLGWTYNQQGIVCTLESTSTENDSIAYQRFLNTGPIALLPLGNGLFSLVWSCKDSIAAELMSLPEEDFIARVNNALQKDACVPGIVAAMENVSSQLGLLEEPPETPLFVAVDGKRAKFPLGFSNSSRYIGPRTVLLGDAAHRVHPLAGQGANIGFRGVQYLCREIEQNSGRDLGDYRVLNSFETKLQRHVFPMTCFIDGMNKMYTTTFDPIVAARSFGLGIVNKSPLLKNLFLDGARN